MDLAASAADDILEEAVDNTLDSGLASVDGLRRYLRTRRLEAVAGVGRLTALVHDRARYGIPRSKLERKLVRLFDRFGIPQPVRQYPVGGRRLDFAYPEQMVAIEVDGRRDHAKKTVFEEDRRRQNEIVLAGWTVLRFTWDDVTKRPATVAEATRQGLASTGGGS